KSSTQVNKNSVPSADRKKTTSSDDPLPSTGMGLVLQRLQHQLADPGVGALMKMKEGLVLIVELADGARESGRPGDAGFAVDDEQPDSLFPERPDELDYLTSHLRGEGHDMAGRDVQPGEPLVDVREVESQDRSTMDRPWEARGLLLRIGDGDDGVWLVMD